ncbi:MAG: hypothetical protein EB060_10680 [Proteobacteria bacterium]|nr:hypothetical protein [Pseudomonadota bacterium]
MSPNYIAYKIIAARHGQDASNFFFDVAYEKANTDAVAGASEELYFSVHNTIAEILESPSLTDSAKAELEKVFHRMVQLRLDGKKLARK